MNSIDVANDYSRLLDRKDAEIASLAAARDTLQARVAALEAERLLLRTCDACGTRYDRANGGLCRCGAERFRALAAASDDNEPVTPEFMESLGGDSATARDLKRYEICGDAVRVLFHACAGPLCWEPYLAVGKDKRLKNPTRGMVRKLAALLADARTPPVQRPRATSGTPLNSSAVASGGVAPATGEEL